MTKSCLNVTWSVWKKSVALQEWIRSLPWETSSPGRASSRERLSSLPQAANSPWHSWGAWHSSFSEQVFYTRVWAPNPPLTVALNSQTQPGEVKNHSKVQYQGKLFRALQQWFECRWAAHNPLLPCPEDILEPGFNVGWGEYKEKRIGFIMPSQILLFFLSHSPPLMSPFVFLFLSLFVPKQWCWMLTRPDPGSQSLWMVS